jgi:hypothetical protein
MIFVRCRILAFLFSLLLCASASAQTNNIVPTASPKLKKFISDHPESGKTLDNALANAFSNRTCSLFYFYRDTESEPRAYHYYPNTAGMAEVVICVRENQKAIDEFITILYEIVNSRNESGFQKIIQDACSGTITREQYAERILKLVFVATKAVRATLLTLKFQKEETDPSYYYRKFIECPTTDFQTFLSYSKKVSPQRDAFKEYEQKFDSLQKMYRESNPPASSRAKNK